ncbi:MAG: response regulator [Lachnospiraceae bacterium]|nr:response regulator [Lachnospiraceae bacterium]
MENVENVANAEGAESVASVAILSVGKGVIVNGIERKLKEAEIGVICAEASVESIKKIQDHILLFILYVSESVDEVSECSKYLRELVDDTGKGVVVVAPKLEWDELWKQEPGLEITAWYDKLLDMEAFAEYIKSYLAGYESGKMKKKILVVDDDSDYAKTVREWMKAKYNISVVSSGAEAIDFLKQNQTDLVLLDYDMPETNGAEVLKMLREEPATKRVPVILLTAVDDKQGVASVLGLDLQGYILKDTEKEKVLVRITRFFHTQNMLMFK